MWQKDWEVANEGLDFNVSLAIILGAGQILRGR